MFFLYTMLLTHQNEITSTMPNLLSAKIGIDMVMSYC